MLRTRSNPRPPQVSGRFSAACNPKTEIQDCRQRHEICKKMQEIHSTLHFLIPFQANWVFGNCGRLKRVSGEKQLGQAKKGRVSLCPWSSGVDEFRSDKLHFVLWKIQKRKSGKLHWLFKLEKWKIKRSKRVGNAAASSKELKSWYKIVRVGKNQRKSRKSEKCMSDCAVSYSNLIDSLFLAGIQWQKIMKSKKKVGKCVVFSSKAGKVYFWLFEVWSIVGWIPFHVCASHLSTLELTATVPFPEKHDSARLRGP